MKKPEMLKDKIKTFQLLSGIVVLMIFLMVIIGPVILTRQTGTIETAKTQAAIEQANQAAATSQADFLAQNPDIVQTIDLAIPDRNTIVSLIEKVEIAQKDAGIAGTFNFTSLVPVQEANQYYVPFSFRATTDILRAFEFMRRFEKLPYLTKINSVNLKVPSGQYTQTELTITGRVYVQDAFKN